VLFSVHRSRHDIRRRLRSRRAGDVDATVVALPRSKKRAGIAKFGYRMLLFIIFGSVDYGTPSWSWFMLSSLCCRCYSSWHCWNEKMEEATVKYICPPGPFPMSLTTKFMNDVRTTVTVRFCNANGVSVSVIRTVDSHLDALIGGFDYSRQATQRRPSHRFYRSSPAPTCGKYS
jgi:hypothetical protein